jgi:hypothetical protein
MNRFNLERMKETLSAGIIITIAFRHSCFPTIDTLTAIADKRTNNIGYHDQSEMTFFGRLRLKVIFWKNGHPRNTAIILVFLLGMAL